MFEHAVRAPRTSARLTAIFERLSAEGQPAPVSMRRLNRILGFGDLRRGAAILHLPIQALTLWDFHVIFALDRWRERSGSRVRGWLEALGELDALSLLATARRDNPEWAVPEIGADPSIEASAIGHPLIPDARRVANDITIGPPGTVVLITGSNMSGKSTLLRAIGLNTVLAQAGGCVCAKRMRLPECDLQTSIRVQDSLELGLSYFMAALARLKGVVDAAEHDRGRRVLLFLLDEILQGTNSIERSIAVRAVTRHLLDARRDRRDDDARSGTGGGRADEERRQVRPLCRDPRPRRHDALRLHAEAGACYVAQCAQVDEADRNRSLRVQCGCQGAGVPGCQGTGCRGGGCGQGARARVQGRGCKGHGANVQEESHCLASKAQL